MLADVFRIYVKLSQETHGLNPLNFISLSGLTYPCAIFMTKQDIDYSKSEELYLPVETLIRGCVSGVFGPSYGHIESKEKGVILHKGSNIFFV